MSEWLGDAFEALEASGVASSSRPENVAPNAEEDDSDLESSFDGSAASDGKPRQPSASASRGQGTDQQVATSSHSC